MLLSSSKIDLDRQRVITDDGEVLALSEIQTAVLAFLAGQRGREQSVEDLWHKALRGKHGSAASMHGLVARLREKIEDDPGKPEHLVKGEEGGYRLVGWESTSRSPSSLPEPDGPLLGRELEQQSLYELLEYEDTVLVSVVGPPGSGASQLALRAAWRLQSEGVEVHRAGVGGRERFSAILARSMGIRSIGRPNAEVLQEIGQVLADRDDVMILLDAPRPHGALRASIIGWLAQRPKSIILVAGREPLGIPEEKLVKLGPLGLREAMALYRNRVARYRPGIEVSDDIAMETVKLVDCMPVSIEAVAAQTAFSTPDVLLDRIRAGMDLELGEGGISVGLDARLTEMIEELEQHDRNAMEQLVAFRGGFDLRAAEAVVVLPRSGRRSMLTVLGALEARSMVQPVEHDNGVPVRWSLYETVRNHLRRNALSHELEGVERRHAEYFGQLGIELGAGPWVESDARAALHRDRENLQVALQRGGSPAAGASVGLTAILGQGTPVGTLGESVEQLVQDLKPPSGDEEDDGKFNTWWAACRVALARVQLYLGQGPKARKALRAASPKLTASDVRLLVDVAWMFTELGSALGSESNLERITTTDPWVRSVVALLNGRVHFGKNELKASERSMVEALYGFGEIEAAVGVAHTQRHLAEVLVARGRARRAVAQLEEARRLFEEVGDVATVLQCRTRLAELMVGLGDEAGAADHLDHVMAVAKETSASSLLGFARGIRGAIHAMNQRTEEAERMFYLALASPSAQTAQIQSLLALSLLLDNNPDTAREEARDAMPHPVARAIVAQLERGSPPQDHEEALLVYEALEAWRAQAALERIDQDMQDRASVAVRMVLAAPPPAGAR